MGNRSWPEIMLEGRLLGSCRVKAFAYRATRGTGQPCFLLNRSPIGQHVELWRTRKCRET